MKCEICGKEIEESKYTDTVVCSSTCFGKKFWKDIIVEKEKYIIIHGKCYYDAGNVENPLPHWPIGHGGRRFWIKFNNGTVATTNNLWYRGEIPEEFRKELPDTAEFYLPDHMKQLWSTQF